jgi:hypothetical protein
MSSSNQSKAGRAPTKKSANSRKKAPKPNSVKSYFSSKTNFQGFCLSKCRYKKSIDSKVFCPRNYGSIARANFREMEFCKHCLLTPCITVEHLYDIHSKKFELSYGSIIPDDKIADKLERFMVSLLRKYFGSQYIKDFGTPPCVLEEVVSSIPCIKEIKGYKIDLDNDGICDDNSTSSDEYEF